MTLYSIEKLINETRRLAAEFRRTTGTMLPVSGEIARYDVCYHIGLELCEDSNTGYDACYSGIGDQGLRVQIKSRVIGEKVRSGHRIGQLNFSGNWDVVILSLMNNDFEPVEMYQIHRDKILDVMSDPSHKAGRRGVISVAKFKAIADMVWCRDKNAA